MSARCASSRVDCLAISTDTYARAITIAVARAAAIYPMARFICGSMNGQIPIVIMSNAGMITSAANPLVKDVRRAIARGGLSAQGYCVAEGFHLLEETLRSGCEIHTVLAAESALSRLQVPPRIPVTIL